MIRLYSTREAETTILKRVPLDDFQVTDRLRESLELLFGRPLSPQEAVSQILTEVRTQGDTAVQNWSARLDGVNGPDFRVSAAEMEAALAGLDVEIRAALMLSADRIRHFYQHQPLSSWIMQNGEGTLGQLVRPIRRVGIYVPGGTAPLPSTVLMSVVPAQVAGVSEIVLMVPPEKNTGKIAPVTLAAAALLGVHEVYTVGGAQAIGALAYGTESMPAVDKIVGPGNLFVTLAKRQVFGIVGIDGLAGPTETMIIADESAQPEWVAADLLAQAEHDVLASAILLTPSEPLARQVQAALAQQLETLPRQDIILQALESRSGIVLVDDISDAVRIANRYGPEHLCLVVADAFALSEQITAAGGIFLGDYACEVLGDYVAGPSHVMPTSGTARFASPLNLWDFVHLVSLVGLNPLDAARLSRSASVLARAERLEAHARAADYRAGRDQSSRPNRD